MLKSTLNLLQIMYNEKPMIDRLYIGYALDNYFGEVTFN